MNLKLFLLILRARYKVVLFTLLGTVAVTLTLSVQQPKQYTASASLVIDVKSPDSIAGMILPASATPGYMSTQIAIINSDRVAQKVVKLLKLDENPAIKEEWIKAQRKSRLVVWLTTISERLLQGVVKLLDLDETPAVNEDSMKATDVNRELGVWLIERLRNKLTVEPPREGNVIEIVYESTDPVFAAAVANAFAQAYIDTNIELKVEPAQQFARWFGEQGKALRADMEQNQAKFTEIQQKRGLVASDERLDNETAKLIDLSAQLTVVQAQTADALSKQRSGNAAGALPEVSRHPVITGIKTEIARLEAELQQNAGNVGRNHPSYQRAATQIAALKQQLEIETRNITRGFSASRSVSMSNEAELKAAIEAQKKKLLGTKRARDELAVLMRDVETSQKAYDSISQQFNQASLAGQLTQSNISMLTAAVAPSWHSSPKIGLNGLIAVFLGALLGVGAALMFETNDRRIRSVDDLAEMLQLPVLGVIKRAKARHRPPLGRHKTALLAR